MTAVDRRALDDLVLQLNGLVRVRAYREERGAAAEELAMFSAEIDRTRETLERVVRRMGVLAAGSSERSRAAA
jgi:hypothetical protein